MDYVSAISTCRRIANNIKKIGAHHNAKLQFFHQENLFFRANYLATRDEILAKIS
jgi:hypothetical protein